MVPHNGMVIHNYHPLGRTTPGSLGEQMTPTGPTFLQDHGDPVRFRNSWLRSLD